MFKYLGIALIVLALAMAIFPQYTNCSAQGRAIQLPNGATTPMKCHWTAQAEIAVAVPLLAVGAMMTLNRRKEANQALAITGVVLGAFSMLLPTYLIGVCPTPTMVCHALMSPALVSVGAVVTGASLIGAVVAFKKKE